MLGRGALRPRGWCVYLRTCEQGRNEELLPRTRVGYFRCILGLIINSTLFKLQLRDSKRTMFTIFLLWNLDALHELIKSTGRFQYLLSPQQILNPRILCSWMIGKLKYIVCHEAKLLFYKQLHR